MTLKSKILIIDDDAESIITLNRFLKEEGYELFSASSGKEGLEKALQIKPDVIISDLLMPGMNGFVVCREVRNNPVLSEIPVILITAAYDVESRIKGIESGADDFLHKPFDYFELRMRLKNITRLNRYHKLLSEREKFQWIIEHSDQGVVILDETGGIKYANPKAKIYLNLPEEPQLLSEKPFLEWAKKSYHLEPSESWMGNGLFDNTLTKYLVSPETGSSRAVWLKVDGYTNIRKEAAEAIIRFVDVTSEIALHQDMWTFHSVIFHKNITPLYVMLGSLEILSRNMTNLKQEDIAQLSQIAFSETQRLRQVIEDILQYIQATEMNLAQVSYPFLQLPKLIQDTAAKIKLEQVALNMTEEARNKTVRFSGTEMETLLLEIFENSKKFHPEHTPHIIVNVKMLDPDHVSLSISDNGITLPPLEIEKICLPYYQGEKYFTGEMPGMGLGLSLVTTLLWKHGGTCRVSNRSDGKGIQVDLGFPVFLPDSEKVKAKGS
jgi:two-component system, cell cycle response regulator